MKHIKYVVTKKSELTGKRTANQPSWVVVFTTSSLHQMGEFALRFYSVLQRELFWEIKIMRKNMKSDIEGDKEVIRTASF